MSFGVYGARRGVGILFLFTILGLAAVGCTSQPQPSTLPSITGTVASTTTAPPSTSPTGTPSPPVSSDPAARSSDSSTPSNFAPPANDASATTSDSFSWGSWSPISPAASDSVIGDGTGTSASDAPPDGPPSTPETPAGALAFAKAYIAEMNRAGMTGDTTRLKLYVGPDCGCQQFVKTVDEEAAHKAHLDGPVWTVHQLLSAKDSATDHQFIVDVYYDSVGLHVVQDGQTGAAQPSFPRQHAALTIRLVAGRWIVVQASKI